MAKFAGYGFNKSHAAAYALVAYQTAYLKANYPVEFMAASMTLDLGNTDKLGAFPPGTGPARHRAVAARHQPLGGRLLGRGRPEDRQTRHSLRAGRGQGGRRAGDGGSRRRARRATAVSGTCSISPRRLDTKSFNRRQFESLVKAGAFDSLDPNRAQSFAAADCCCARPAAPPRSARAGRKTCSPASTRFRGAPVLAGRADWPPVEKLQHEFDAIGFYLSSHPLDPYGKVWSAPASCAGSICRRRSRRTASTRFRLAGIVIGKQGAHLGARQPLRLRPVVGQFRRVRGHRVFGSAGAVARAARQRPAADRHGRCAARGRQLCA